MFVIETLAYSSFSHFIPLCQQFSVLYMSDKQEKLIIWRNCCGCKLKPLWHMRVEPCC